MISIIFIVLAGVCKAVKDTLCFHFNKSVFSNLNAKYWNPNISWTNKYKDWKTPKFFGSTTFLVWLTDAWHLFDFLQILLSVCAIVFYNKIIWCLLDLLILYCAFTLCFEVFFRVLKRKNI